jgi:hypothetical protein
MILYELLTGEVPLRPDFDHAGLKGGFSYILEKNSERAPEKRYQSVAELRAAVQEITSPTFKTAAPEVEFNRLTSRFEVGALAAKEIVGDLDRLFAENEDDESFYTRVFPKISIGILREYCSARKRDFYHRFKQFDLFVNGSLPFEYTDVVANLYRNVYRASKDIRVRSVVIERLLVMGDFHNRWHVRDVLSELLYEKHSEEEILAFRDILLKFPDATKWLGKSVERAKLEQLHKAAIKHCDESTESAKSASPQTVEEDDEIPF